MIQSADNSKKTVMLNERYFSGISEGKFIEGSPHLKHHELAARAFREVRRLFEQVRQNSDCPAVLDMGAGEGMLTLPLLEMGASVTAVDATRALLDVLVDRAAGFKSRLTPVMGDIFETLEEYERTGRQFDLICASSFLHHIPDYLKLCRKSAGLIRPKGIFFTFQDPLRYDTLPKRTYWFDRSSYFAWRLFQGNYIQGFKTRLRRLTGAYCADLPEDAAEYHVVRNGVDQMSIQRLFETEGFTCEIQKYWSTQSSVFQHLGSKLGLANTFSVIATKHKDE
jgi:SAM-dependent methyltransferase